MRNSLIPILFSTLLFCLGCSTEQTPALPQQQPLSPQQQPQQVSKTAPSDETMTASYYGGKDGLQGKRTASGETFNSEELTAAHKTLPIGTKLQVTNPKTKKSVTVRVNDRGPYSKNRDLDLSKAAADQIGLTKEGKGPVQVKKSS